MRKIRNITIAVTPEPYRQTRQIAADFDCTVTELVRDVLRNLPDFARRFHSRKVGDAGADTPASTAASAPQPTAAPIQPVASSADHNAIPASGCAV